MLGAMYAEGKGVPQNFKISYVWLNLSAAQGDKTSIDLRDIVAKKLTPQQLSEAQDQAAKLQSQIDNQIKK
jgi:TPR repeat protein